MGTSRKQHTISEYSRVHPSVVRKISREYSPRDRRSVKISRELSPFPWLMVNTRHPHQRAKPRAPPTCAEHLNLTLPASEKTKAYTLVATHGAGAHTC